MSELIEQVTNAINRSERRWLKSERAISLQEATARAAIKAMWDFKVTARMIEIGNGAILELNQPDAEHVYRCMMMEAVHDAVVK